MPNGMNFDVFGPVSVRRNDNYNLNQSRIEAKMPQLQAGKPLKYKILGDSAYWPSDVIVSGGGRGIAAVRQPIEYNYKDLKTYWKYLDYKQVMMLRK